MFSIFMQLIEYIPEFFRYLQECFLPQNLRNVLQNNFQKFSNNMRRPDEETVYIAEKRKIQCKVSKGKERV